MILKLKTEMKNYPKGWNHYFILKSGCSEDMCWSWSSFLYFVFLYVPQDARSKPQQVVSPPKPPRAHEWKLLVKNIRVTCKQEENAPGGHVSLSLSLSHTNTHTYTHTHTYTYRHTNTHTHTDTHTQRCSIHPLTNITKTPTHTRRRVT